MKAQSNYCKLSFKAEENKGEIQEAMASLPADKEISKDAAVVAVLFRIGWCFHIKRQTKKDTEGFPGWKRWFWFIPDWLSHKFWKRKTTSVYCSSPQGMDTRIILHFVPIGSLKLWKSNGSTLNGIDQWFIQSPLKLFFFQQACAAQMFSNSFLVDGHVK